MNEAHLHLLFNHFPIIGIIIGILILIAGFIYKNQVAIKRIASGLFILAALFAVVAYLTGEGAEEVIENLPDSIESITEEHEDAGKFFLILAGLTGLLSVVTLYLDIRNKTKQFMYTVTLLVAIAASISGLYTGSTGGKVRHTEIRKDNQPAQQTTNENNKEVEEDD